MQYGAIIISVGALAALPVVIRIVGLHNKKIIPAGFQGRII
jgi:hypothetical protein